MHSKTLGEQMWKWLSKAQAGTQFFFWPWKGIALLFLTLHNGVFFQMSLPAVVFFPGPFFLTFSDYHCRPTMHLSSHNGVCM